MKKKFEIKVAYLVYDYYTVTAENEEEAKELAKEKASTDSLNDFLLQETTADVIKIEDCNEEEEEEKSVFEVCFWYNGILYRQAVIRSQVEQDTKNPEGWYYDLESHLEGIHFRLYGHYDEHEDPYLCPRTLSNEEMKVQVFNNFTNEESWINKVEVGK